MANFYFTYGNAGHPFYGGWTVVDAPNDLAAVAAFRAFHPDKHIGLLNCACVYDEPNFMATKMAMVGNLGARCHEVIFLQRELSEKIAGGHHGS